MIELSYGYYFFMPWILLLVITATLVIIGTLTNYEDKKVKIVAITSYCLLMFTFFIFIFGLWPPDVYKENYGLPIPFDQLSENTYIVKEVIPQCDLMEIKRFDENKAKSDGESKIIKGIPPLIKKSDVFKVTYVKIKKKEVIINPK